MVEKVSNFNTKQAVSNFGQLDLNQIKPSADDQLLMKKLSLIVKDVQKLSKKPAGGSAERGASAARKDSAGQTSQSEKGRSDSVSKNPSQATTESSTKADKSQASKVIIDQRNVAKVPPELLTPVEENIPKPGSSSLGKIPTKLAQEKVANLKLTPDQAASEGDRLDEVNPAHKYLNVEQTAALTQAVKGASSVPVVVEQLPTSFSQQLQAVAEYIQVTSSNLQKNQTVCIKLQQNIMPDAQIFVSRQPNLQLTVTMASQREDTIAWFNNLAPNLANHLGSKLREPVEVSVKNLLASNEYPKQGKKQQQSN